MNRICVLGVYIGKLPNYFPLWLKSCEWNPTVDFLLFTDGDVGSLPDNVKHYSITLDSLKAKASGIIGFEVCMETPYKLCDYRPMFGEIFADYISDYDYWGYCDFDMIFGDLQASFDKYDLYKYDRMNALGHLSLYKNTLEVNRRYLCEGAEIDYNTVFTNEQHFAFEEYCGMTAIYVKQGFPFFKKQIYADISCIYDRYRIVDVYLYDKKMNNYPMQIFYWEKGKCFRAYYKDETIHNEEYQYVHFKQRENFPITEDITSSDAFYITKYGFVPKQGEVTKEIISKFNPYRGAAYEAFENARYSFRTRVLNRFKRLLQKMRIA